MAKLTIAQWQSVREAYEVGCKSSTKLSKEYGVAESTICRRMKKDGWNRGKTQDVIEQKVNATKAFAELTQENASITQAVNREAERRLRLEGVFIDSIEYNQDLANKVLKKMDLTAELNHINLHSQITTRNKDGVLGKMPQTQVNIQTNVSTDADSVISNLRKKHQ